MNIGSWRQYIIIRDTIDLLLSSLIHQFSFLMGIESGPGCRAQIAWTMAVQIECSNDIDLEMNLRLTCGFWLSVRKSRNAYPAIIKASPIDRFDIKIEAKKPSFHILLAAQIDSPLVVK